MMTPQLPSRLPFSPETRSLEGVTPTQLTFVNATDEPVHICWIDYEGVPQPYRTLAPDAQWRVATWVTHAWAVFGADSGRYLARAIAAPQPHTVSITQRERATAPRTQTETAFTIQPLYVVPADGDDHQLDTNGTLTTSIMGWNGWFEQQTHGSRLRVAINGSEPDIVFVRLTSTGAALAALGDGMLSAIAEDVKVQGFDDPKKIYAVYYDGVGPICGVASQHMGVAAVYLQGELCPEEVFASDAKQPGYWEFVMMHELLHALGCVPHCAPNNSVERPGHVDDSAYDIMYYRPATHPLVLDVGRDDYYGHGRAGCFDLARSAFLEPTPANAIFPQRWQRHVSQRWLAANPQRISVGTTRTGPKMTLEVVNQSSRDVVLHWIDANSVPYVYAHIPAGGKHKQHTYAGHAWVACALSDLDTATIVEQVIANAAEPTVRIS